jgi:nucleoside-diphosphate-sugar epimerase
MFGSRTGQYVHISSGSIYAKPVLQAPISESTPIAPNPVLEYATAKWRAELALQRALTEEGFPVTVVRPSHTYDDANPPVPGAWTVLDRLARGAEIPVHGDGTSLWTLTHAEDFAHGLVGLLGNPRTIGEVFNITGEDVYTWDQIYTILADALGVEAKLVHVASELFPVVAPDWFWSGEVLGDIGHTGVFDTTKIRRFVPGFAPRLTFHRAARRMVQWRTDHPDTTAADPTTEAVLDRIVDAYHAARDVFAERAPRPAGVGG